MVYAARSFGSSTPLWVGAAILSFALWWPLGLAVLLSFLWSRHMMCGHRMRHWRERGEEMRDDVARRWRGDRPVTGNRVFDDYRAETLRRLEEEQREFVEFLERLRRAKDQSEFDEFMAERNRRPSGPAQPA
jgi:hypothetical protein